MTDTAPPTGYVPNSDDCNDNNANIYPGATELCNGVDDDCDGATDEGCVTYYEDADGDGYGNPAVSVSSPAPPPGYVSNSGDCDDTDPNIYPGASELCNNFKDDDCDGLTNEVCALAVNIRSQVVSTGEPFDDINLDNRVTLPPGYNVSDVEWTTTGGVNISVLIDGNRVAHITYPPGWRGGSERITFRAEVNPSGSTSPAFTVLIAPPGSGGGSSGACVGGTALPVDKLALIAPWIALIMSITATFVSVVIWRRKRNA